MIFISNDSGGNEVINLTVGDDAVLTIPLKTDDGEDYELGTNEYLIFSVREKPDENSELLIEAFSDQGSNDIVLTHDMTANMEPGYYSAEVQYMSEDQKRITVWPKLYGNQKTSKANRKNFCLMTEVVYR